MVQPCEEPPTPSTILLLTLTALIHKLLNSHGREVHVAEDEVFGRAERKVFDYSDRECRARQGLHLRREELVFWCWARHGAGGSRAGEGGGKARDQEGWIDRFEEDGVDGCADRRSDYRQCKYWNQS